MPLIKGKSKKALGKNIATEEHAGKPPKQAIAIAFSVQRRSKKAYGGGVSKEYHDRERAAYADGGDVKKPQPSPTPSPTSSPVTGPNMEAGMKSIRDVFKAEGGEMHEHEHMSRYHNMLEEYAKGNEKSARELAMVIHGSPHIDSERHKDVEHIISRTHHIEHAEHDAEGGEVGVHKASHDPEEAEEGHSLAGRMLRTGDPEMKEVAKELHRQRLHELMEMKRKKRMSRGGEVDFKDMDEEADEEIAERDEADEEFSPKADEKASDGDDDLSVSGKIRNKMRLKKRMASD